MTEHNRSTRAFAKYSGVIAQIHAVAASDSSTSDDIMEALQQGQATMHSLRRDKSFEGHERDMALVRSRLHSACREARSAYTNYGTSINSPKESYT